MKVLPLLKSECSLKNFPVVLVLILVSVVYELLITLRLFLYRSGLLPSYRPSVPVISVGNLTIGGTGKTPMVDFLLQRLESLQIRPAILSRGYRRKSKHPVERLCYAETPDAKPEQYGDEPFLLAQKHPKTPVYVGKKRSLSAQQAEDQDHPDCLVLDDGYQHLAIRRDLNLLLIDAERGLGNRRLLPWGPFREPEHQWRRADAIIITKSNLGFSDRVLHRLQKELHVTCPIFKFDSVPVRLDRLDGKASKPLKELKGAQVMLSSGIAQPEGFSLMVSQLGAEVTEKVALSDHQEYTPEVVGKLMEHSQENPVDLWITTEKDAVKLREFPELHQKVWVLEAGMKADPRWDEFFLSFLQKTRLKTNVA